MAFCRFLNTPKRTTTKKKFQKKKKKKTMKKTQIPAQCSDSRLFCMVTSIFVCLIVIESIALSLDIVSVKKSHFG